MKKKLIIAIISAVVVAGSTVGVVVATKHEHNYTQTVTAPTCTAQGYTTYTCECGESYIDNYVDKLGHLLTPWITDKEETCFEDGHEYQACSICKAIIQEGTINAHHTEGEWTIEKEPTCLESGIKRKYCLKCEALLEEDTIKAIGHAYKDVSYTWNKDECTAMRECSRDSQHIENEKVIAEYVMDSRANCESGEKGHYKATFYNPAFLQQETAKNSVLVGEPLPHEIVYYKTENDRNYPYRQENNIIQSTNTKNYSISTYTITILEDHIFKFICETTGSTSGIKMYQNDHKFCDISGCIKYTFSRDVKAGDIVKFEFKAFAGGFSSPGYAKIEFLTNEKISFYENLEIEASCTKDICCYNCKAVLVNKKAHSYTYSNTSTKFLKEEANCYRGALYYYSCECGAYSENTFEYGDKKHNWDDGTIITNATCASVGEKKFVCACGESKTEEIAKTQHQKQFMNAVERDNAVYANMYCSICDVAVEELCEGPKVYLSVTSISFGSNNTISYSWQISADGGIGQKSYACMVYNRQTGRILSTSATNGYGGVGSYDGYELCLRVFMYDEIGLVVYDFIIDDASGTGGRSPTMVQAYHLV